MPLSRAFALSLCLAATLAASTLPDKIGTFERTANGAPALENRPLWDEFGLEEADQAQYGPKLQVQAYRLKDSTGAYAASQWLRGADPKVQNIQRDNYVLIVSGGKLSLGDVDGLMKALPKVRSAPPPNLTIYLPTKGRVAGSERYILGETSLKQFLPQVPAEAAGFNLGAEAALAEYGSASARYPVAVFSYPTPQIARQRLAAMEALPGAKAFRTGPLVAVTFPGQAGTKAEQTLNSVHYDAIVTLNEKVPKKEPNIGVTMISIFMLAGILIGLCLIAGIGVGVVRVWRGRRGGAGAEDAMIVLHLSDK